MRPQQPHHNGDPSRLDSQYLEDLACASWYSEALFAALELDLFSLLAPGSSDLSAFALQHGFEASGLERLLKALQTLALVEHENGYWFNSQLAGRYLVRGQEGCLIDFLLYRRYIQEGWQQLTAKIAPGHTATRLAPDADYQQRNFQYVQALDQLARLKAAEISELIKDLAWQGPILDIGGGAGALSRALLALRPAATATLFEIPEVLEAADQLYGPEAWHKMRRQGGDFRNHDFGSQRFGLIILGNFLHAYDPQTSQELLTKACSLLNPDGLLVIHDYFPDRQPGPAAAKGSLYDLHMLANTYNGGCLPAATLCGWLAAEQLDSIKTVDLASDSSLILASPGLNLPEFRTNWPQTARECGFRQGVEIYPNQVVSAAWVRSKCQCGCQDYGRNLHCPPHGRDHIQTAELLSTYSTALLVEGRPPGRDFHNRLLDLERRAFLAGHHKALVLGAGPCPVCKQCPTDGPCRFPDLARPSMEAGGIDVYATAEAAGIRLQPLTGKDQYVKYIGLLLIS